MAHKLNENISEVTKLVMEEHADFTLECRLGELLEDRGLTLQELSYLTGIRIPSLSFIVNEKKSTINIGHLIAIAKALRITDIRQLYMFDMEDSTRKVFNKERREQEGLGMTDKMRETIAKHKEIKERESEEWKKQQEAKKNK
ncbi:helix-turn-helix transcriptional regulator [Priestia aryabhattai]|uniref:helix-turn-helix domain-containing protein n=1 Tax=Priestia aryabhattai TaxID=412384 RepID=UPI003D26DBB1